MANPNHPKCLEPPQIHGEGVAGSVLRCHPGVWEGADQLEVQWLRHGKPVLKAPSYFILETDIARPISAVVIATNKAGQTISRPLNVVKPQATAPARAREEPHASSVTQRAKAAAPPGDFRPIATTIPEVVLATAPPPRRIGRPT